MSEQANVSRTNQGTASYALKTTKTSFQTIAKSSP